MAREKNTHTKIKTATEHHTRPIKSYFSSTPTPAATRPSRPKTGLSLAAKPSSVQGVKPIASFFSVTASNSASLRSYLQTDNDDHDIDEDDAATKVQYCSPKDDDWLVDSNELPEMPAAAAKKYLENGAEQGDILSQTWIHFDNARSKAHPVIQGYLSCRSDWDQYSAAITVEPMFTFFFLTKQQPSTLEELKQFPGHKLHSPVKWAVYLVILEKSTERPALYIGAITSNDGISKRFREYNDGKSLSGHTKRCMANGYIITHKARYPRVNSNPSFLYIIPLVCGRPY